MKLGQLLALLLLAVGLAGCPRLKPVPRPISTMSGAQTATDVCQTAQTVAGARGLVALGAGFLPGTAGRKIADALTMQEVCIASEAISVAAGICVELSTAAAVELPEIESLDLAACGFAPNESPTLRPEVVLFIHGAVRNVYQPALLANDLQHRDAVGYGIACEVGDAILFAVNESLLEITSEADGVSRRFPGGEIDAISCEQRQRDHAWALLHSHIDGWEPTAEGFVQ